MISSLEEFYYWVMEHDVTYDGMRLCSKENFSDVEKYLTYKIIRWNVDTILEYKNGTEVVMFKFGADGKPVGKSCTYSVTYKDNVQQSEVYYPTNGSNWCPQPQFSQPGLGNPFVLGDHSLTDASGAQNRQSSSKSWNV